VSVPRASSIEDPVVVYDVMREAANRLVGFYATQVTVGGMSDPAIQKMREVRAMALAVDPRDMAVQKSATEQFRLMLAAAAAR
jgi:hypothetical protein